MLRFICSLLLILSTTPLWAGQGAPIEIYAAGKRYLSLDAYKHRNLALQEVKNTPQQIEELKEAAEALGVEIDLKKIKTIEVKPLVSAQTQQKLKLAASDRDLDEAVADFRQNWNNPNPQKFVNSQQLEDKIREAVGDYQDPVLLISDHGKMRIMALTPQEMPN